MDRGSQPWRQCSSPWPDAKQQRLDAAIASSEYVCRRRSFQMIEQDGQIVGHLLVGDLVWAVMGSSLVSAIPGDDLVMLAEVLDRSLEAGDAETAAVHRQDRFTCAVNFVIQLDSIVGGRAPRSRIRAVVHRDLSVQGCDTTTNRDDTRVSRRMTILHLIRIVLERTSEMIRRILSSQLAPSVMLVTLRHALPEDQLPKNLISLILPGTRELLL